MSWERINFSGATTVLVGSDAFTQGLITQMLRAFGMNAPTICETGAAAKTHLEHHYVELCIFEAVLPDMDCVELIHWVRRENKSPFRFVPVIVLTSYTQHRHAALARDAGANLIIKKLPSPHLLFDRIAWVAKASRQFVETAKYAGPDRRFSILEPLDGKHKRENDGTAIADMDRAVDRNAVSEPSPTRAFST